MLRDVDQMSRARLLANAQRESVVLAQCFPVSSLGILPLEWALMFVFLILAAAAGG